MPHERARRRAGDRAPAPGVQHAVVGRRCTSPVPDTSRRSSGSASSSTASRRRSTRSLRQSWASSTAALHQLAARLLELRLEAVEERQRVGRAAREARRARASPRSARTFTAPCFWIASPRVTWPSPPSTACPSLLDGEQCRHARDATDAPLPVKPAPVGRDVALRPRAVTIVRPPVAPTVPPEPPRMAMETTLVLVKPDGVQRGLHRRGHPPPRGQGPPDRRPQALKPAARAPREALRRPQGAPVLREPPRLHVLRPRRRHRRARRGRHRDGPPHDGLHQRRRGCPPARSAATSA